MSGRRVSEGALHNLFGWRLAQARVATDEAFDASVAVPSGLRPVEVCALELLRANPGFAPAQLARALSISRPQVSQLLDRLEARGLAQRSPSGRDGRGVEIHVSERGDLMTQQALQRLHAAEATLLNRLTQGEQAILLELLAKLAAAA